MTFEFKIYNRNCENNTLKILSLDVLIFLMESCEADRAVERWPWRLTSRPPRKKWPTSNLMTKLMLRNSARSRLCVQSDSVFVHPIHAPMRVRLDVTLNKETIGLTWTPDLTPNGKNNKWRVDRNYECYENITLTSKLLAIDLMTNGKERALMLPTKVQREVEIFLK